MGNCFTEITPEIHPQKSTCLAGDEKTAKSELWAPWDGHSGPLKHQMLALNIVMGENYYSAKMDGLTMFDILITK